MKNKKILICLHDITTAIQVITYLEQSSLKIKQYRLCIILNSNYISDTLVEDVKFIFRNYKIKILKFHTKEFKIFSHNNFFEWPKIILINKLFRKKIKLFFNKNSIEISSFSEILYTNDRLSNYINYDFKKKKIYFFHGVGDFKIFTKINFLKRLKNFFFNNLNKYINKVVLPCIDDNFAVIYFDKIKFNKLNLNKLNLNNKIFKIKFKEYFEFKKKIINKKLSKKFILLLLKFPRYNLRVDKYLKKKFFNEYCIFILNNILSVIKKKNNFKNLPILIKTKNNLQNYEIKSLNKIIKKNFKKNNLKLYIDSKKNFINAEFLGFNKKCSLLISNFSTADFIIKKLRPDIKIWSYNNLIKNFYKINFTYYQKEFMDKKIIYNFNQIIKPSNFYKYIK